MTPTEQAISLLTAPTGLILIAIGLSLGFRAGIWNIGAEGQYIMGAICGAAVGLAFYPPKAPNRTMAGKIKILSLG